MQVTKTVQETRALIKNWKKEGKNAAKKMILLLYLIL